MVMRSLCLLLLCVLLPAAEAVVELPQSTVPGVWVNGTLTLNGVRSNELAALPEGVSSSIYDLHITQGMRSQMSVVNGTHSVAVQIEIRARFHRLGQHTVDPLSVQLRDGSTLNSKPLQVLVEEPREDLTGLAKAEVSFDPQRLVPGQRATMVYEVFTNDAEAIVLQDVGLSAPTGLLSVGDMRQDHTYITAADGNRWKHYRFEQDVRGTEPGTYRAQGQQDYYRVLHGRFVRKAGSVPIKPGELVVGPLPTEGQPVDFSGLIGDVQVQTGLDRDRIAVGETAIYTLTIIAEQAGAVGRPEAPEVPGLQFYEQESDEPVRGTQQYRWYVEPVRPGTYRLPSPSISYFDSERLAYRRAEAEPAVLDVVPGRQRNLDIRGTAQPTAHGRREGAGGDSPSAQPLLPQRGGSENLPAWWLSLIAFLVGLVATWSATRAPHWRARSAHSQARFACSQALAEDDLETANRTAHSLRARATDPEDRAVLDEAISGIEHCRFGQGSLPADLTERVRQVEERIA